MRIHRLPVSVDERKNEAGIRWRERQEEKEEAESTSQSYVGTEVEPLRQVRDHPLNAIPVQLLRGTSGFRLVRQYGTVHLAFRSSYSTSFLGLPISFFPVKYDEYLARVSVSFWQYFSVINKKININKKNRRSKENFLLVIYIGFVTFFLVYAIILDAKTFNLYVMRDLNLSTCALAEI